MFVTNSCRDQRGQIGIIMLLIMTVLLTVGLSLAANTNKDLIISQQEEESARVFNAAEAGVEKALNSDLSFAAESQSGTVESIDNVDVNYQINKTRSLEMRLQEGTSATIDVTGATAGQQLYISWSKEKNCATQDPASILVSIYSIRSGNYYAEHFPFKGEGCQGDGFPLATTMTSGEYAWRATLSLRAGDQIVRVKALYNDTHLAVIGNGWQLPVQGYNIRSEAKNELGNEARAVEVRRSLPSAPSVLDYGLFAGGQIVKQ